MLPAVFVLGPVTVSRGLGGPGAWAAVVVAFGIGAVLGDLLLLRIRPRRALRAAALGLVVASLQAAVYGSGTTLAIMCVLQLLAGIGVTIFWTLWEVSLQEHVPGGALSRVSSFDYMAGAALMPRRHRAGGADRRRDRRPGDAAGHERARRAWARWPSCRCPRSARCRAGRVRQGRIRWLSPNSCHR